jgi:hypothetical protein
LFHLDARLMAVATAHSRSFPVMSSDDGPARRSRQFTELSVTIEVHCVRLPGMTAEPVDGDCFQIPDVVPLAHIWGRGAGTYNQRRIFVATMAQHAACLTLRSRGMGPGSALSAFACPGRQRSEGRRLHPPILTTKRKPATLREILNEELMQPMGLTQAAGRGLGGSAQARQRTLQPSQERNGRNRAHSRSRVRQQPGLLAQRAATHQFMGSDEQSKQRERIARARPYKSVARSSPPCGRDNSNEKAGPGSARSGFCVAIHVTNYLPQISSASSTQKRSLAHCSSSLRMLPSSVEAKPHCGDNAS